MSGILPPMFNFPFLRGRWWVKPFYGKLGRSWWLHHSCTWTFQSEFHILFSLTIHCFICRLHPYRRFTFLSLFFRSIVNMYTGWASRLLDSLVLSWELSRMLNPSFWVWLSWWLLKADVYIRVCVDYGWIHLLPIRHLSTHLSTTVTECSPPWSDDGLLHLSSVIFAGVY